MKKARDKYNEDVEKLEYLHAVGRYAERCSHNRETATIQVSQKIKNRSLIGSNNLTSEYIFKIIEIIILY